MPWDHTVLPDTGKRDIPAFTAAKLVLDLATPGGYKAELTYRDRMVTYLE